MNYSNKLTKKILEGIYFFMIISAYIGTSIMNISMGSYSIFPFRILILFLWLLVIIISMKNKKVKIPLNGIGYFIIFLSFWIFYAFLTLFWARDFISGISEVIILFNNISIIFFSILFLRTDDSFKKTYKIIISIGIVFISVGIWELVSGSHLPISAYHNTNVNWPSSFFLNTNDFSSFLSLTFPFFLSLFRHTEKKYLKGISIVGMIITLYIIMNSGLSGSRANILAIILQLSFLFIFIIRIKQKLIYFFLLMGLFFVIYIFKIDYFNYIYNSFFSLIENIYNNKGSSYIRLNLIINGIYFLYLSYGFGVGAGNIEYNIRNRAIYNTFGVENIHNWWFEILVNYGLIIFILYIYFYLNMIYKLFYIRKHKEEKMISEALLLGLIGVFFSGMSPSTFISFRSQWIIIGLSVAYIGRNYYKKGVSYEYFFYNKSRWQ